LVGDLVISEVLANPASTDDGNEYIEIYNASGSALDLEGLVLQYSTEDPPASGTFVVQGEFITPETVIDSGAYLVFGGVLDEFKPAHVDVGYANAFDMRNGGARITVLCGDTEVDSSDYPDSATGTSFDGAAAQLDGAQTPDHILNDNPQNFCAGTSEIPAVAGTTGSPGAANDCFLTIAGMCNDAGTMRATVAPTVGDVVITEFMPNPEGTDTDKEWIEIFAINGFDLNGMAVGRPTTTGTDTDTVSDPMCLPIGAGNYILFAQDADSVTNGGLPVPDQFFSFSLLNSNGEIFLEHDGTTLDTVTCTSSTSAASKALDPTMLDPVANDNEANFSDCGVSYGAGGNGTPRASNAGCDTSGMCMDGGSPRAAVAPVAGDLEIVEWHPNPSGADTQKEFFEIKVNASVDLNGVQFGRTDGAGVINGAAQTFNDVNCLRFNSGDHVLLVKNVDPLQNGGILAVDVDFVLPFTLNNSNAGIFVGPPPPGTPLDIIQYVSTTDGTSTQIDSVAATCPTPAGTTYGDGDGGSPGLVNPACP
jgi:hypothetical protein